MPNRIARPDARVVTYTKKRNLATRLPAEQSLQVAPPKVSSGGSWGPEVQLPQVLEAEAPESKNRTHKLAAAAALALTAVGAGAGLVGSASPAYAESVALSASPASASFLQTVLAQRDTTPVRVNSAQEVVDQFQAQRQLYVQGDPLPADVMGELSEQLARHPNMYVVLVDYASNFEDYDFTVATGIGNSDSFASVRNPVTGEKEGVVFTVMFDSNDGRKVFMRSEELPDRLGVGEENFADEYGNPERLLRTFLRARDRGENMAGMLGSVFAEINTTIKTHTDQVLTQATSEVGRAERDLPSLRQRYEKQNKDYPQAVALPDFAAWQQQVGAARQALDSGDPQGAINLIRPVLANLDGSAAFINTFEHNLGQAQQVLARAEQAVARGQQQAANFRKEFGEGGQLGSPDLDGWKAALEQVKAQTVKGDFAGALATSNSLVASLDAYGQATGRFTQAQSMKEAVSRQIADLEKALKKAPDNGHTEQAREDLAAAKAAFEQYQADTRGKSGDPLTAIESAQSSATAGLRQIDEAHHQANVIRNTIIGVGTALTLATVAAGLIANARARTRKKEALTALSQAEADIGRRSKALIELMEQADVKNVSSYAGETQKLAQQVIESVTDSLTLMGGAEKFLAESRQLIEPNSPRNLFTSGNFHQAIGLLTDPEQRLPFSFEDSARAVMEKGSRAESWREELERRGASREFEKSLFEVLGEADKAGGQAKKVLAEIDNFKTGAQTGLAKLETTGGEVSKRAEELEKEAEQDKLFPLPSVREDLLARVLDSERGLLPRGRALEPSDPVRVVHEFVEPGAQMLEQATKILNAGQALRGTLGDSTRRLHDAFGKAEISTEWADTSLAQLASRLDDTADKAPRVEPEKEIEQVRQQGFEVNRQFEQALRLEFQRQKVEDTQVGQVEAKIAETRRQMADQLHELGVFQQGTAEGVLREEGSDPDRLLDDSKAQLGSVKQLLGKGKVAEADRALEKVAGNSTGAEAILSDAKAALQAYPTQRKSKDEKASLLAQEVGSLYTPALERMQAEYAPEAVTRAAGQVGSGETFEDDIPAALETLGVADQQLGGVTQELDQAHVLAARNGLILVGETLEKAERQLKPLTEGVQVLDQAWGEAVKGCHGVEDQLTPTLALLQQDYVRTPVRELAEGTRQAVELASQAIEAAPHDPYRAMEAIGQAQGALARVRDSVASEGNLRDRAVSAIANAEKAIARADKAIQEAAQQSWSWSNAFGKASAAVDEADLARAKQLLAAAAALLPGAQPKLDAQDYEGAAEQANSVIAEVEKAEQESDSVVDRARASFDSQKSKLEAKQREADEARRREEERRRAEQRRREEEQRRAEEARRAEQRRREEEQRRAEERRRDEERRRAEEARRAEQRRDEERRRAEEQRRADERRAEERRRADEQRRADEKRRAEEQRRDEERRRNSGSRGGSSGGGSSGSRGGSSGGGRRSGSRGGGW
ncbi:MAG: hypothetical protein AB7S38_02805 [Vulcanimicrobiota bacterium]